MTEPTASSTKNKQTGQNDSPAGTKNTLSEKQFRQIEGILNTLIFQKPSVISSYQIVDGKCDITYVSDNLEQVVGYKPVHFIGNFEKWKNHVHPDDIDLFLAGMFRHTVEGKQQSFEYRFKNSKGQYQWIYDQQRLVAHKGGKREIVSAWWDITDRRHIVETLRQSESRFQKMLSLVPDMISIQDPEMNIVYSNWSGLGEVPEEKRILGEKCYRIYRGYDDVCRDCHAISVLHTKKGHQKERELRDGRWIRLRVAPILDENNNVEFFVEWIRDITESKRAEKKLEQLATTDDLTGLWNRRFFMSAAAREIERARRYGQHFSIAILDIDKFKNINDTCGHAAGDAALQHMAKILNGSLRQTDILGRIGGEEFSILLPNTLLDDAVFLAERLRSTIEKTPADYAGKALFFTVSIGLAAYHEDVGGVDELLLLADKALYEAKEGGRNCVVAQKQ